SAKVDGRVTLGSEAAETTTANTQQKPEATTLAIWSGTPDRAAEVVGRPAGPQVKVSCESRGVGSLYLDGAKYILEDIPVVLGYDRKFNTLDHPASPRGSRILGRIPRLPKLVIQAIVRERSGLDEILAATDAELEAVEGVGDMRARDIREGLRRLQEINLVDR